MNSVEQLVADQLAKVALLLDGIKRTTDASSFIGIDAGHELLYAIDEVSENLLVIEGNLLASTVRHLTTPPTRRTA